MDAKPDRNQARALLEALLPKVLEDGHIDPNERAQLTEIYKRGLLTTRDVLQVFGRFLGGVADDVLADGVVTDDERGRCRALVRELRIPDELLPEAIRAILKS